MRLALSIADLLARFNLALRKMQTHKIGCRVGFFVIFDCGIECTQGFLILTHPKVKLFFVFFVDVVL